MFYQNKNNPNSYIYIESLTPKYGIIDCQWLSWSVATGQWVSWASITWLEELESKFNEVQ